MDIGTEELSHLEIVGTLARMHLRPLKFERNHADADPLVAIAGGGGVNLYNSMGSAWTADYLKITGELDVDLRSNIAAEARAKIVYERLINFCDDAGSKDALQFLMTREITHMRAFTLALESLEKPAFSIGRIAPTAGLVDQFVNASTGAGDHGDIDARGPSNEGGGLQFVESAALEDMDGLTGRDVAPPPMHAESTDFGNAERMETLLQAQLRELLQAEKQLVRALPRLAKSARSGQLSRLISTHLEETEAHVERLTQCLDALGASSRSKTCKGMSGLIDEGQDVVNENAEKDDVSADLALIAAAQRVEHYEIAAYTTSKNLARQIHNPAVAQLLTKSLGEEENADQLLDQLARSLMSVSRMPASVD